MEYMKVKGHDNLIRDPKTNSIINTNTSEYKEYISKKRNKIEENQKIQNIEEEVVNIKSEIQEIKFLLRSLLDGPR
jgi:uncharacterized HAD superfamily protein